MGSYSGAEETRMMKDIISASYQANEIKMIRSTFSGTFLLVEGNSDKAFYKNFVNQNTCRIKVTMGKQRAIDILQILDNEDSRFAGILVIVDADFDRLESSPHQSPNLLRTDTHDLETMILQSPALDKLLAIFATDDKLKEFGRNIRTALLKAGMSIGYFLWLSRSENLNLTFDGIKFKEFIDDKTLQINELKLINEVKNKSQPTAKSALSDPTEIQKRIAAKKKDDHDPWQVCRGHDLVEILSIGLRKALGSNKAIDVEARSDERKSTLENQLMLAYEAAYFLKTQLYQGIMAWESNNQPFRVLPHD
jgi:ribosomal protein L13E